MIKAEDFICKVGVILLIIFGGLLSLLTFIYQAIENTYGYWFWFSLISLLGFIFFISIIIELDLLGMEWL